MKPSMILANKTWKEGVNSDSFVVFPDALSFHEARHLIGPVFGAHEPLTMWIMESFENGKDPTFNACILGFAIHDYLYAHGGTVLGKRDDKGTLEAAVVIRVYSPSSSRRGRGCWDWVKETVHFTRAMLSIYWSSGLPSELYHPKFNTERRQFEERVDIMRKVYAESHKKVGLDADYWYIALVGVSAASQGKGLGREIMRRIGHVADQQHKACYLETFGEKNIRFYQSLGYDVVREIEVVDEKASSSVPGVVMVRPSKPKDEGAV